MLPFDPYPRSGSKLSILLPPYELRASPLSVPKDAGSAPIHRRRCDTILAATHSVQPNSMITTEGRHGLWSDRRTAILREAVGATWLPWLSARAITIVALLLARAEVNVLRKGNAKAIGAAHSGLLGLDAGWYRSIASFGYGFSHESLRFFPLLPLLTRGMHDVTRIPIDASLLIIANGSAFLGTMLVFVIAKRELGDTRTARVAVWIASLAPPAFVYVMGYSESLFLVLTAATLLCIRSDRWGWAVLWGFLAGTARPVGLLLFLPVLIEACRTWGAAMWRNRVVRIAGIGAPILGLVTYLTWVSVNFGGFLTPIRLQRDAGSSGISNDPFLNFYRDASSALRGSHIGTALHLPWLIVALILCVVVLRALPLSYGVFASAVVVAGLFGGSNFASFERYAMSAFPLVIGAATLCHSRRVGISAVTLCGAGMFAYALAAFLALNIP